MASNGLRERARTFPPGPGVYLWKSEAGEVLYVGKADSLRARVLQYFGRQEDERKSELMDRAADLEFVAVASRKEALLLEQTLIKQHRPPYNVILADDKTYPYIAVTDEEWPRIIYTRDLALKGDFFGPFPDAGKAKRVARMLNRTFRLRQCRTLPKRECLYFHLKQCSAPCIAAVSPGAYAEQVEAAREFLRGRLPDLRRRIAADMDEAARDLRYERAAELRDLVQAVESVLERQRVDTPGAADADALGFARRERRWCAVVLFVRGGAVVGRESYFLNAPPDAAPPQVVAAFLEQHYAQVPRAPRVILLPLPVPDPDGLARTLAELHGRPLVLRAPERGDARRWVGLAEENARLLLDQEFALRERQGPAALESLRDALRLPEAPAHIDCFDVSHHAGEHTVASLVVLRDGKPSKSDYRRFRIRTTSGGDDPGAMRECVERRYARLLAEEGADALPDLIVVDGGPTQVRAALGALSTLGLEATPLVGLAKRLEEVWRPHALHPVRLDPTSPALHLLQRARDEAHRFAIGYQAALKRKAFVASALDEVPGVGPERRRRLLTTFGSVDGLRRASPGEIARVPGIPRALAERIHRALRAEDAADAGGGGEATAGAGPATG